MYRSLLFLGSSSFAGRGAFRTGHSKNGAHDVRGFEDMLQGGFADTLQALAECLQTLGKGVAAEPSTGRRTASSPWFGTKNTKRHVTPRKPFLSPIAFA